MPTEGRALDILQERYNSRAKANNFYDWEYARWAWRNLDTLEKLDAEKAKYAAVFDPWLEVFRQDPKKAYAMMDSAPKKERLALEHGYDLHLAQEHWENAAFRWWAVWYEQGRGKGKSFNGWLATAIPNPRCYERKILEGCGFMPDWRTPEINAEAKALEERFHKK